MEALENISFNEEMSSEAVTNVTETTHGIHVAQEVNEGFIYVGPNMPTRGLLTYQVYDKMPIEMERFAEEKAVEIRNLFIPISKFQGTRKALENPNSLESVYFNVVEEQYTKEVRERNV